MNNDSWLMTKKIRKPSLDREASFARRGPIYLCASNLAVRSSLTDPGFLVK